MNLTLASLKYSLRLSLDRARGSLSITILWLCVAVHILVFLLDQAEIVSARQVIVCFGLSYEGIFRYFRLHQFITAVMLHGGITHLVFNMLALWMLGPDVERMLRRGRYFFFSLFCAFCGFSGFLAFNWGSASIVIGYSGVIFGIMIAQAIYFPNRTIALFGIFPLKMKYAILLLGAIELYLTIVQEQNGVANAAHLFGALGALLYLKFPRLRREGDIVSTKTSAFSDGAGSKIVTADWGSTGSMIVDALQKIAICKYDEARQCLRLYRVPWSCRLSVHHIRILFDLAERFEASTEDADRNKVETKLEFVWKILEKKQVYPALEPLADFGLRYGDRIIFLLIDTLCHPLLSDMPTITRQSLEQVLAGTGNRALQVISAKIADSATTPDMMNRIRILLPSMNLKKHASVFMKTYARSEPEAQARLVNCLADLTNNSTGALCDFLAGILNRMPPDLRLAYAIQTKIGDSTFKKIAFQWAIGGHSGAQTVLSRLYDYNSASFCSK